MGQSSAIGDIEFPVTFESLEDPELRAILGSVTDLQTTVEFCDDWQERYRAWDSHGRMLRLRIDELTLLFAAVVPDGWTRDDLALTVTRVDGVSLRAVEMSGELPHRELVLREAAGGLWAAEPLIPPMAVSRPGARRPAKELAEFDQLWVRAVFGRKLTRSNAHLISGWAIAN